MTTASSQSRNQNPSHRSPTTRWGLKLKLVLAMLLVGIVPLLVGLILAFFQGTREIEEVSGGSFVALATETARKLDLVVGEEIVRTGRIATNRTIVDALELRRDRLLDQSDDEIARSMGKGEQDWGRSDSSVRNVILKGNLADLLQRYATGTHADPGQPVPSMTKSATRLLYITDVAGALVASLNDLAPYANAHQPWWQHAFNTGVGQPSISDLAFDDRVGVHTFSLSLPILDSIRYEAVGVLHRVYDAAEFFAPLVHPIRFGKTGHVMLIDSAGRVLSCPILPTGTALSDPDLIPMVTKLQPGWVRAPSDGHGHAGTSIIGFASLPATSRITAQATGRHWHTFVWQSSTELFGPVQHLLTWISVFGAVAVGLLVILGYVAAGRIVTPVRQLQHAAKLIGRGELTEPLVIRTGDELEDLADEINRMNAQLELAFAGLTDQFERKSLEVQYLKQATDQILDHVPTPILMLDDEDRIQYVNRAAADAFALFNTDPPSGTLFDILPLEARARDLLREEVQAYRTQPADAAAEPHAPGTGTADMGALRDPLVQPPSGTLRSLRKELRIGGRSYRYEWFRIGGPPGEGDRIGLVFRNVTEESRLQDQLIQAEKSGSLGVLTAGLGHELNNPLFGILGLGEAIQDEHDLERVKQYAKDIVCHGKRMVSTIRDLTGWMHAGSTDARLPLDLNDQLEQTLSLAQRGYDCSEVQITKDYHPLPQIYAAPDDLRQVFLNIITNALQAMPENGRLVLATAARDGQLTVTVQDNGPGISKTYLNRIFDPFFTTKGQGEGAGLGLTVAQRIVTKYGGRIQFDSQEGQGTLCRITFPLESMMRATAPKRSSP